MTDTSKEARWLLRIRRAYTIPDLVSDAGAKRIIAWEAARDARR